MIAGSKEDVNAMKNGGKNLDRLFSKDV